jgi:uncharacterized iron-regulated membrane protein
MLFQKLRRSLIIPMKTLRNVVFWLHLSAGVIAGSVILIMSVTGVALTYEKQVVDWADRQGRPVPSSAGALVLSPETLLARVMEAQPGTAPTGLTMRADPKAAATVIFDGNKTLLVNPHTGATLGEPSPTVRAFFRTMTSWHRYLALDGASRSTGRMVTGACNLAFLFIVLSGPYLWLPKIWSWIQFKKVLWFRRGLPGKAREFNWHNVIGVWSAVPLAIVVAGAVPISYPWASNLVYRLVGEAPPAAPSARLAAPRERSEEAPAMVRLEGMDAAWRRAQEQVPSWRAISIRLTAPPHAPLALTIDGGYAGQPQKRGTLTIDRSTSQVVKWETFDDLTPGRRLRTWLRFAHTGEFYGISGQTVAGLASAGGAVLAYTGMALAVRRLWSWLRRRRDRAPEERVAA